MRNNGELDAALTQARCGHQITATGSFSGSFALRKSCGQGNPIVLRSGGNASFTNATITLAGSYGIVTGMSFSSSRVVLPGDHNRVAGNVFRSGTAPAVHIIGGGSNNRVDHNELTGLSSYGIQIKLSTSDPRIAYGNLLDSNYIHENGYPLHPSTLGAGTDDRARWGRRNGSRCWVRPTKE